MVRLSEIEGLMINNKILPEYDSDNRGTGNSDDDYDYGFYRGDICGYNDALTQQGSKCLRMNKGEIIQVYGDLINTYILTKVAKTHIEIAQDLADALIANDKKILEC